MSAELGNTEHPRDVELVRGLRLGGSLEVLGSSLFPELRVFTVIFLGETRQTFCHLISRHKK